MTTTMMPKPRLDKQQIAVANIKLLLDASHSKKKDLAEYMGKSSSVFVKDASE